MDYPSINIYLITIPNVKQLNYGWSWPLNITVTDNNLSINEINKINDDIRSVASTLKLNVIDINPYIIQSMYEIDGIHLNSDGDEKIAELVYDMIE